MPTIWIDGTWHDKDSGRISVFDHGLLYGDGVFEGIRVYAGKVFKLPEHLDRLWESAHAVLLEIPMPKAELPDGLESGIYTTLPAGNYTAIVAGNNGATGVGLVEVYNVTP